MSFDFPSAPTEGQEYTPAGGPTYVFKAPRWMVKGVPGGMPDAPNDGKPYVRKSLAWDDFSDDMALKESLVNKGVANGYAGLDGSAKVPAIQLPAYVDDVVEYASLGVFPASGAVGIIYVALDTNKVYRWSGTVYVEISPSPGSSDAVPEGSVNLYYTAARSALKADLAGPTFTGDPKAPTPATADNDTSIATTAYVQANMALKANSIHGHAQSDITNLTADLALKAPLASPTFTGVPAAPTAAPATNTTQLATTAFVTVAGSGKLDASVAATTYAPIASPTLTGDPKAPTPLTADSDTSIATTAFVQANMALKANVTHTHVQSDITGLTADLALKAPIASPTFTGKVTTAASFAGNAGIILPHGAAPTAPVNGDIWTTTTGLFARINSVTVGPYGAMGSAEPPIALGTVSQYWRGDKSWQTLDKTAVGLANVDNTSDVNKPVSTAQAAADALKAPIASPVLTGNPQSVTPTAGDSSTSIATTAFVQSAVAVAKVTISDTAPAGPIVGQLWYESDSGVLMIYYNDGTSTQWVQIAGSTG